MDLQLPVRVLIAEDDPMVCSLHVQAVRQLSGFAVAGTVSDGFELLEFFKRNTADLIVMDIFMPRLSGLEALKRLRSRGNATDVILVSAGKKADLVSRARTLGAFDYMIKPYSLQRFRASLENYLEHRMRLRGVREETTQEEVDAFFGSGRQTSGSFTARRYLEYLAGKGGGVNQFRLPHQRTAPAGLEQAMKEAAKNMAPEGLLFFSTPTFPRWTASSPRHTKGMGPR